MAMTDRRASAKFVVDDILSASASTPVNRRSRATNGGESSRVPESTGYGRHPHLSSSPSGPSPAHYSMSAGPSRLNRDVSSSANAGDDSSPQRASFLDASSLSSPLLPFHSRPAALAIQEVLNDHLPLPSVAQRLSGDQSRATLSSTNDPKKYMYRYMHERLMERSEVLDNTIDEAAQILMEYYQIDELGDPSLQSQEDVFCVGRLCPETDETKMTATSTWLESSRMLGSGSRVRLQLEENVKVRGAPLGSGGVGLFPGCIVGIKGKNGGGKLFTASEILMMPPIDATYTAPSELHSFQYGTSEKQLAGNPLSVFAASGPYTIDANLEFEPLRAMLEMVEREKPDVLILLGPFIDSEHPLVKSGDVDETPQQMFRSQISSKLVTLLDSSPRTTIILIPNGRDMTSHHLAYPQAPLAKDTELGLPRGVKCLPNPTTFSVNEVVFAVTSVDILFHLRNQEYFRKCGEIKLDSSLELQMNEDPNAKDMMARTCRHLLRQRSFYPLVPAPQPTVRGIDALNLDVTHQDLVKFDIRSPDVVIVPSMLKHFTRIVDSTIMLNPSFLTRGNTPGTFARLTVHPLPKEELERGSIEAVLLPDGSKEVDSPIEHRLWERCRVDVIRV